LLKIFGTNFEIFDYVKEVIFWYNLEIWNQLANIAYADKFLAKVGNCWQKLEIVGKSWKLLGKVGNCWEKLEIVGKSWKLLVKVGNCW